MFAIGRVPLDFKTDKRGKSAAGSAECMAFGLSQLHIIEL